MARTRSRGRWDGVVLGAVALVVGVAFSWQPSIWYDEAATIGAATRSWAALWAMVQHVDAVHAVYYATMHLWFDAVGYTPFTLRLPSAIAGAAAVGLTVVMLRSLAGRRVALLAGIVLLVLPRMTWAMAEGRSYALTVLLAVASTSLLSLACGLRSAQGAAGRIDTGIRPARREAFFWVLYALVTVLSVSVFAYLALVVVAHAVTLGWLFLVRRLERTILLHFVIAVAIALAITTPLLLAIEAQSGQVGWIRPPGAQTVPDILITQYFPAGDAFAVVGWVLALIGAALLVARVRGRRAGSGNARRATVVLAVALPLLLIPTAALVLASVAIAPLYSPRYLTFTAPAIAVLIATALDAIRARGLLLGALTAIVALAVPSVVGQRGVEAKQESSWSEVAATIGHTDQTAVLGRIGVLYGRVAGHPTATQRVVQYAYPEDFAGLADPTLETPISRSDQLWETQTTLDAGELTTLDSVWTISSDRSRAKQAVTSSTLTAAGFHETRRWHYTRVDLVLYRH
jgi:mannosyltransferase